MNKEKRTPDRELEMLVNSCVILFNLPPSGIVFLTCKMKTLWSAAEHLTTILKLVRTAGGKKSRFLGLSSGIVRALDGIYRCEIIKNYVRGQKCSKVEDLVSQ